MARINVIYKPTGQAGSVEDSEFDPNIYAMDSASAAPQAPAPPPAAVSPAPQPVSSPVSPPQPQGDGLLKSIGKALIAPGVYAGKTILGTGFEAARKADYLMGNKDAYDVLKGKKNPFQTRDEASYAGEHPFQTGIKTGAAVGSYIAPVGAGSLASAVGHGAVQGALYGAAQGKDIDPKEIAKNAILSAATGGILYGAGKAIKAVGSKASEKLSNSIFKETTKATKSAVKSGETLGKQALERGEVGTSEGIRNGAMSKIDDFENALQQKLVESNATIGKKEMLDAVKPLVDDYTRAGNAKAAQAITNRIESIAMENGDDIPAAAANQIKRTLYDEANKAYGTEASAGMEGIKAIARSIKEAVGKKVPGVDQINKNLAYYGRLRDSMTDLIAGSQRNNVVGLSDIGVGGLGGLFGGGVPGAAAAVGAKKLLGSTIGKTAEAQILNKGSQGLGNILTNPLALRAAEMGAEGIGTALSQPQQQGLPQNPQSLIPQAQAAGLPTTPEISQGAMNNTGLPETPPALTSPASGYTSEQLDRAYYKALQAGDTGAAKQLKEMAEYQRASQKADQGLTQAAKAQQVNPVAQDGATNIDQLNSALLTNGRFNKAALIEEKLTPGVGVIQSSMWEAARNYLNLTSKYPPTEDKIQATIKNLLPSVYDNDAEAKRKLTRLQARFKEFYYTKPTDQTSDVVPSDVGL